MLFNAVALALLAAAPLATAQESTGGLYGSLAADARQPDARLVIRNVNTNAVQIRQPEADGRYSIAGLSPGEYEVTLMQGNQTLATVRSTVRPGSSTAVPELGAAAAATDLGKVQVMADRLNNARDNTTPIDVSTPELVRQYSEQLFRKTGTDTSGAADGASYSNLLTQLPSRFMSQVVSGPGGSGLASFNGGSGTETRYYVNEFDTTYDYTGAGANSVPGEMIGYATVIAGGASAKYSNAMGGSVSAFTKTGDNTWRGGYSTAIYPPYSSLLKRRQRVQYLGKTADGLDRWAYNDLSTNGQVDAQSNNTYWASGPLIKDRLFVNVALQNNAPTPRFHNMSGETRNQYVEGSWIYRRSAANLSWNITENQQFDATMARAKSKNYSQSYTLAEPGNADSERTPDGDILWRSHDDFYIGRYRWRMNDAMDFSLMGGYFTHMEQDDNSGVGLVASRVDRLTDENGNPYESWTSLTNKWSGNKLPVNYRKRGLRADWTWQLGDHKIGLGAERYYVAFDNYWEAGNEGNYVYYNYTNDAPWTPIGDVTVPAGTKAMVSRREYGGGNLTQINRGAYLEDYWQVADNLVVYAGLRRDNSLGRLFNGRRVANLYTSSPRAGISWDVRGDSSMKLGATYGRYSMVIPGVLLSNLFNRSGVNYDVYSFDGINPDGSPIGAQLIGSYATVNDVGEPRTMTARNLQNSRQDNYSVYFQANDLIPNWAGSIEFNHTSVKRALSAWSDLSQFACPTAVAEDGAVTYGQCSSPAYEYLKSLGYDEPYITNSVLVNPGRDIVLTNDFDHDGTLETVTIPAAKTGLPKPRRESYSVTLDLNHPETPELPLYIGFNYTWKHVYGNWEGYYGETNGNVLGSPTFRWAGLGEGAGGNLPADVRHAARLNVSHAFGESGFRLGAGLFWQSGAPKSCYSQYPVPNSAAFAAGGISAFYCDGKPVTRGSLGRFPSFYLIGLNASWEHTWGAHRLSLEMNVDNILNRDTEVYSNPFYTGTSTVTASGVTFATNEWYGTKYYLAPRSAWFAVRYNWN